MEVKGSANGKLLLFGEHAAVHGFPAVGIALPVKTEICIHFTDSSYWDFSSIKKEYHNALDNLIQNLFNQYPSYKTDKRGKVTVYSEIKPGRGFGSSAALCVALVRCFESLSPDTSDFLQLWERAHTLEHQFHGRPSGIDTGLSVFNNLHAFYPDPVGIPGGLPGHSELNYRPLYLVAGTIPRKGNTKDLVLHISHRLHSGDIFVKNSLNELGSLSEEAINVLQDHSNDVSAKIGLLANNAHTILKSLGLSTNLMETLLSAGINAGALGGKLSGAGGGGAFYLVAQNKIDADKITTAVIQACPVCEEVECHAYIFK